MRGSDMEAWIKVVTHPLGLAGFALFLVFVVLGKTRSNDQKRWLGLAFLGLAAVVLVGGLVLAYFQITKNAVSPPDTRVTLPSRQTHSKPGVQQTTYGSNSPAVNDITGAVTINVNDSRASKQEPPLPCPSLAGGWIRTVPNDSLVWNFQQDGCILTGRAGGKWNHTLSNMRYEGNGTFTGHMTRELSGGGERTEHTISIRLVGEVLFTSATGKAAEEGDATPLPEQFVRVGSQH
jgi:hypothetical protein